MAELLRLFTGRGPEPLSEEEIKSFGVQSHPDGVQSDRYQEWLVLCTSGEFAKLEESMIDFLQSDAAVKTLEDLPKNYAELVRNVQKEAGKTRLPRNEANEKRIQKERAKLRSLIERAYVQQDGGDRFFEKVYTAVADTMVALAHLRQLGNPENINYQLILKTLSLTKWSQENPKEAEFFPVDEYLELPVLIPVCFSKHDPCKQGQKKGGFSFLDQKPREIIAPGCTSGNCTCEENQTCLEQSKCCAQHNLYVIDLLMVKDVTKCFRPGEVSYIRNILSGETLTSVHKASETTEEFFETETTSERTQEDYLETNDTSKLNREITSVLTEDRKFDAGIKANYVYGKEVTGKIDITANAGYSNQQKKEVTNKEVRDYSRNVIDRSTVKVTESIRNHRTFKRTRQTEETNTHSFDNTTGDNVNGQYLYVDKVSQAQVYNYGKKAVMEFYLPEPAALYNHLWKKPFEGIAPLKPETPQVNMTTITPDNYEALAQQYGVTNAPAPPDFKKDVVTEFRGNPGDPKDPIIGPPKGSGSYIQTQYITIPPDYYSVDMSAQIVQLNYNKDMGISLSITFGGASVYHSKQTGTQSLYATLPALEGTNPAVLHAWDVTDYTWILTVHCALKAEVKAAWQKAVYDLIIQKYNEKMEVYNTAFAAYTEEKEAFELEQKELRDARNSRHPDLNRDIERRELKRMAISYLSCQFFDQFDAMKSKVRPCGYPEMYIAEAQEEGRFIQFFEQAFDWGLMTYLFYPYFWSRKCTWQDKIQDESGDFIFNKFLTAGSARVLVPVRDGYFDLVQYYLATGQIWGNDGVPPLPNDPHFVSMAQEMKEQRGNYYTDRVGTLDVTNGSNVITLNGNTEFWNFLANALNTLSITADTDREILIDFKVYRIVSIVENTGVSGHTSWFITLDRPFEGDTATQVKWSTGALFVGSAWEYTTPTNLLFLRKKSNCLPCYPLEDCSE